MGGFKLGCAVCTRERLGVWQFRHFCDNSTLCMGMDESECVQKGRGTGGVGGGLVERVGGGGGNGAGSLVTEFGSFTDSVHIMQVRLLHCGTAWVHECVQEICATLLYLHGKFHHTIKRSQQS